MKFLAILRDSFREAVDSKVLYVMVILSLVVVVFVSSISYRPLPADKAFPAIVEDFAFLERIQNRKKDRFAFSHGNISDLRQTNESSQPFLGEYRLTLHAAWRPRIEIMRHDPFNPVVIEPIDKQGDKTPAEMSQAEAEEFLKTQFKLHDVEVLKIERLPEKVGANSFKFDVEARGLGAGRSWLHETSLAFGAFKWPFPATLGRTVFFLEDSLVNGWGAWLAILVSIIITAFFIPNMLHKGTIDLLLAKPIGRSQLLVYKFVGGLTFMFLNSAVAVGGIWLVIGLRSGIWAPGFLLSILVLTFFFAVLYSISTLIAVLTRSAVICILVSAVMWLIFAVIGKGYLAVDMLAKDPNKTIDIPSWVVTTMSALHAITPRTTDLDYLITKVLSDSLLSEGEIRRNMLDRLPDFRWGETFGVSGAFIAVMLGLACWRFSARDY